MITFLFIMLLNYYYTNILPARWRPLFNKMCQAAAAVVIIYGIYVVLMVVALYTFVTLTGFRG